MKKRFLVLLLLSLCLALPHPSRAATSDFPADDVISAGLAWLNRSHGDLLESTTVYYTIEGYELLGAKKSTEAVEYLQLAIQADPNYAPPHYLLGKAYFNLGRFDEARQAYLESKRLNPELQIDRDLGRVASMTEEYWKNDQEQQKAQRLATEKQTQEAAKIIEATLTFTATPMPEPDNENPDTTSTAPIPPPGAYYCIYLYWDAASRLFAMDSKGYLILQPTGNYHWVNLKGNDKFDPLLTNGPYEWLDKKGLGRYRYNAANRQIKFLTGLLAQPGIVAQYTNNGTQPRIIFHFSQIEAPMPQASTVEWQGIWLDSRIFGAKSVHEALRILKVAQREQSGEFSEFVPPAYGRLKVTPGVYTVYGLDYLKQGDYANAARALRAALNLDPDYGPALFLLGLACIALKNFDTAEQSLNLARSRNQYYLPEVEAAGILLTAAWKGKIGPLLDASRNIKSPPAGTYICELLGFNDEDEPVKEAGGSFTLNADGTYRWGNGGSTYQYRYETKSRKVTFLGGPLGQPNVTAQFRTDLPPPKEDQIPQIGIILTSHTDDSRAGTALPLQWVCTWTGQ